MRQVATLAGVGLKTVSRVINREPNVSAPTIRKVMEAAQSLNYQVDLRAGSLRRGDHKTHTLGLLVSDVSNPFSGAVQRAVEEMARAQNIAVFASSLDDDPQREREIVATFMRRRVDGLILTTVTEDQSYLTIEQEHGTPLVFVDRVPVGINADVVVSDNAAGSARAIHHLVYYGHRKIAFFSDRLDIQTARERMRGFREAMAAARISVEQRLVHSGLSSIEYIRPILSDLMSGNNPPTAIFSSQNLVTLSTIHVLREMGLQHSVAVVGFDDIILADLLEPGLTVIAQNARAIGTIAIERVLARLAGDDSPARTYVVPTELIVRGSGEMPPKM